MEEKEPAAPRATNAQTIMIGELKLLRAEETFYWRGNYSVLAGAHCYRDVARRADLNGGAAALC